VKSDCCDTPWQVRHEGYDAYMCIVCDTWIESQCGDSECNYCSKRPEKPSMTSSFKEYVKEAIKEIEERMEDEEWQF
jgi:hypothetical protein